MALGFTLPTEKKGRIAAFLDHSQTRSSKPVLLLSTLFFAFIDIVIDPLAVRGDRWFLGRIFYYPDPGLYFGVPLSNFIGWAVVGFISISCFQLWERIFKKQGQENSECDVTTHILVGILLYYLVLVFNFVMTFVIGETLLGMVGLFIFLPITTILLVKIFSPLNVLSRRQ
jgi:putative membrane protein